jgi:DNA invertase Pin-like site-specific DNA recombinase
LGCENARKHIDKEVLLVDITPDKILRVAVYCRVSTDKDDQANSLESQQKYFKEYIERNPMWELCEIYVDEGISGTSTKKRKAFNKMMVDAELGKFDMIITKEISRFARNTLDSIYYTRKLKNFGVGVRFANDNLYTLDPDAELRLTIMASIAQEESRKTSERVKWGQKRRMEDGVVFGCSMLGYDVKDGKIYVNPEGAEVVRRIFHKYVNEQKGTGTIAKELAAEGMPSFTNSKWTATVILRTLHNEKYCGDLIQKKTITPDYLTHEAVRNKGQEEFVVIRDHHEPIISRELFEKAQEELKFRSTANDRKARLGRKHCFSGKITCAECGRSYVFHDKIQPNGKRRQIWECYNKKKYGSKKRFDELKDEWVGCDAKPVMDKDLKAIMYSIIENLEINKESVLNTLETQLKSVIDMSEFEDYETKLKQYERVKEQRESLVDLYLDKCLTKDEFKNKCHELDRKIEDMRVELAELSKRNIEKKDSASVIAECLEFARERLQNCEPTEDFIKEILDEMVIHKDKTIEVKLRLIPDKWKFVIVSINNAESQRTPCVLASSNCRLPTSVKRPLSSG